jgi:hypothetical protein
VTVRRAAVVAALATVAVLLWRLRPTSGPPPDAPIVEPRVVTALAAWAPARPASAIGRIAGYAWAAPLTAVGLALGALSASRPVARDGVLVFSEVGGLGARMLRWRGFAAATLGHAVIAAHHPTDQLFRHELVHVRQAERWGPLLVPLYLAGLLRYGYRRNPFERAAYAAAAGSGTG